MLGLGKNKEKEMINAEANGQIKSMPVSKANIVEVEEVDVKVVDNPHDFNMAIGHAQMAGRDYLEVSEELFNYLVKNNQTDYLTYGSPGVKVYRAGTKEKIERLEKLSPDEQIKQRMIDKNG
jgi:hypothetical protein